MTIRVWDYRAEFQQEREEIFHALETVFASGQLILGDQVRAFEREFSSYIGARHGIGVNSATDALFLGLKALEIEPGSEVVTVSNTAVPTVSAIVAAGAIPRFVDIEPGTYLMDTTLLPQAVSTKTRAIIVVHLFGQCVNMDAVLAFAAEHDLAVIEDCAQAHGATFRGRRAGSFADLSAFSFYPTKVLGTYGDGGMIVTNDDTIEEKSRRLRFYGMEKTYYSLEDGYNSRLDEIHAAILRNKLKHLDQYIERRNYLAQRYDAALRDTPLQLPTTRADNGHAFYLYVCRHAERDRIIEELKTRDIIVNISYPWPIHLMPAYQNLGYKEGDLPETELAAKEIFSLPMYPALTEAEQDSVCAALKEIIGK